MLGSVSRRLFLAFACIILLLASQGIMAVLSFRHLIGEFERLDRACGDAREMMAVLHGAHIQAALTVGSRHPQTMDTHRARHRELMARAEALAAGGLGTSPQLDQLREAYTRALDCQYQFAFELARQELAAAAPIQAQAVDKVGLQLAAMEAAKGRNLDSSLRLAILETLVLGTLAIAVALYWANRLQKEFTNRREAEASLAEALQMHENLLEASTQVAITMPDAAGVLRVFNRGAELMLGWRADEVIGKETPMLWLDAAEVEARRQELLAQGHECAGVMGPFIALARIQGSERRQWAFTTRAGERRTMEMVVTRVLDTRGEVQGFLGIAVDVTERLATAAVLRAQEEQLRQSQKMDAIGQLAGGVAHDFNNMLAGILGSAELLAETIPVGTPEGRLVQVIAKASQRAADLTGKLLSFSRKGKLVSTTLDLHLAVRETMLLLERSIDRRIEIRLELEARASFIVGDPSQLENALLNLCINARDAMPEGGTLTLRTGNLALDEAFCASARMRLVPGLYIRLEVRDTGHGIPSGIRDRIFEPFFTTKPTGQGTGLGLAAVYGIVEDHRGYIELDSEPGQGTCFRIYLPLDESTLPVAAKAPAPMAQGGGAVLVVEDEEVVRTTASLLLQSLGYDPILAKDGLEGVQLYQANAGRVQVVLLDMVMPGISGKETAARILALDPKARIVLTSGFSAELGGKAVAGVLGFLHKPYGKAELAASIKAALAAPPNLSGRPD